MISGKMLKARGWPEGKVIGLAKAAAQTLEDEGMEREAILDRLDQVRADPGAYLATPRYADLARECIRRMTPEPTDDKLREQPVAYGVWGEECIDVEARTQIERALRLPVAVAGALMPDAHVGYGLPIGGVLATYNAVIPYAVGVDIACRMRLSVYDASPQTLAERPQHFQQALLDRTRFGMGVGWEKNQLPQHEVLDDP